MICIRNQSNCRISGHLDNSSWGPFFDPVSGPTFGMVSFFGGVQIGSKIDPTPHLFLVLAFSSSGGLPSSIRNSGPQKPYKMFGF